MDGLPRRNICPANQGFLRDAWYVIAFSHKLGHERPLARRCCGESLVLYRTARGQPAAFRDRCPHRGVPLSQGKVVGDALQCIYHGFQFGTDGHCVRVPTQELIPAQLSLRSYPLVEKSHFLWIWMGDAAKADAALIPDHHALGLDRAGWSAKPYFMMEIKANYSLLFENLLDTSHISFLHGTALDSGRMAAATFRVENENRMVRIVRNLKGDVASPAVAKQYGLEEGVTFDRELMSIAYLPHLHIIRNSFAFTGASGSDGHVRINIMPITPADPNHLYQFLSMSASYPEEHPQALIDAMWSVFEEDRAVLEAIQGLYDEGGPDLPECSVKADEAGLRARRMIAAMTKPAGDSPA